MTRCCSATTLVRTAARELADLIGPLPRPHSSLVTGWCDGTPLYTTGHPARIATIREEAGKLPGLYLCGAAYDGVGVTQCVASGRRAEEETIGPAGS